MRNEPYPLTIVRDRYGGVYSGGRYVAWNLEPEDVPEGPAEDDTTAVWFWEHLRECKDMLLPGVGDTPQEAIDALTESLKSAEVQQ